MNAFTALPAGGLYLLTPDEPDTARLLERVKPLLGPQIAAMQLRNKAVDRRVLRDQALALLPLCRKWGIPLLVNDDWRLALEIGADGAHLGATDGDLAQARRAMGATAILGATCHGDIARANRAAAAGASYLAFGAFFDSRTKPLANRATLEVLGQARALGLPTVAIGGITPDNARQVLNAGADFIAVLGAVFDAPDPVAALHNFHSLLQAD